MAPAPLHYVRYRNRRTNQVEERIAPAGALVDVAGTLSSGAVRNWAFYNGEPKTACMTAPPPPTAGDPAFKPDFSFAPMVQGAPYDFALILNEIGTPALGKDLIDVIPITPLPGYLTITYPTFGSPAGLAKSNLIPGNATPISLGLRIRQGNGTANLYDGKIAEKTFVVDVTPGVIYGYYRYEPGIGFRLFLGGNAGTLLPGVQMKRYPAGFTQTDAYVFDGYGARPNGVDHFYRFIGIGPSPSGTYIPEITHYGRKVYTTITINADALSQGVLTFSDVAPTSKAITGLTSLGENEWTIYKVLDQDGVEDAGYVWSMEDNQAGLTMHPGLGRMDRPIGSNSGYTMKVVATKGATVLRYPVAIPSAAAQVLKVAFTWKANNPAGGQPSETFIYIRTNNAPLEFRLRTKYNGAWLGVGGPNEYTPWAAVTTGTYIAGEYDRRVDLVGAGPGSTVELSLRKTGTTDMLFVRELPTFPLSGTVGLTVIFPVDAGNNADDLANETNVQNYQP